MKKPKLPLPEWRVADGGGKRAATRAVPPVETGIRTTSSEDEFLTYQDIAGYLKITQDTVRKRVQRKQILPPVKIGARCYWLRSAFFAWFRELQESVAKGNQIQELKGEGHGNLQER